MEASDSANTEMHYDHIESTIQPEETQPDISFERSSAKEADVPLAFDLPQGGKRRSPEQPLDMPKPKRKGRPLGTKDAYKRTQNSNTKHTPTSVAAPMPAVSSAYDVPQENAFHQASGLAVDRYDQPMGVDMNTLADLMFDRMTVRASDARALRTQRWDKFMPHR